jgi:hypothetical protein
MSRMVRDSPGEAGGLEIENIGQFDHARRKKARLRRLPAFFLAILGQRGLGFAKRAAAWLHSAVSRTHGRPVAGGLLCARSFHHRLPRS